MCETLVLKQTDKKTHYLGSPQSNWIHTSRNGSQMSVFLKCFLGDSLCSWVETKVLKKNVIYFGINRTAARLCAQSLTVALEELLLELSCSAHVKVSKLLIICKNTAHASLPPWSLLWPIQAKIVILYPRPGTTQGNQIEMQMHHPTPGVSEAPGVESEILCGWVCLLCLIIWFMLLFFWDRTLLCCLDWP
jgi:hypothetical protein